MALFQSKKVKQLEQQVKALQVFQQKALTTQFNNYLSQQFGSVNYYPDLDYAAATDKYATSDQLYSIVNKISEASALVPIYPYFKTEDKALRKLKSLTQRKFYSTKGIFDIRVMQMKALEDVPEDNELRMLLDRPNNYQSKTEFLNAAYIYYLVNGECFIYKDRITEGASAGKMQLHILPPANITIHITNSFPLAITGFTLMLNGREVLINVPPEDMIHWKRFNPYFSITGEHLRGLSPLRAGAMPVSRLAEADNRSMNQLKNGAVPGIVYDKTFQGNEDEVTIFDNQKKAFRDFTTNPKNQGAPFFVGTEKGYLPIGLSAADLKLIELQTVDFKRLCNIYKVSDILFNSDVAATESNVVEQTKQMYTSACFPMVFGFASKLNNDLSPDFGEQYYLNPDISTVTEIQDDMKEMIQAIAAMPVTLSGNEQRALLNYEEREEDWMNKPLIKDGYSFYDDIAIEPVDPTLLNTNVDDGNRQ